MSLAFSGRTFAEPELRFDLPEESEERDVSEEKEPSQNSLTEAQKSLVDSGTSNTVLFSGRY